MSEANSELLLPFIKVTKIVAKKLPLRIERKRDSIEFEPSENIGQFFNFLFFIILILLKDFKSSETLIYQASSAFSMDRFPLKMDRFPLKMDRFPHYYGQIPALLTSNKDRYIFVHNNLKLLLICLKII